MAESWPDKIDLDVTGIAQGGDGVGRWQDRPVFVRGALPGETAQVQIRDRQRSFARGDAQAITTSAPERIASPCPFEEHCGAGDWRWVDYQAQLRYKAEILRDQLHHLGGIDIPITAVHGMADAETPERPGMPSGAGWGYRTTVELHAVGDKLGYYAPNSRRVVDVPRCCLHHPLIDDAIATLRPRLQRVSGLSGVTLRCSPQAGQVLAILEGEGAFGKLARRWLDETPALVGVLQRNRGRVTLLVGQNHLIQTLGDVRWHLSAGSFFQINAHQTARLIERVTTLLEVTPGQSVLDLFCGVGTFALPLARAGAQVVGIESYAPAIADARRSAELNGVSQVEWHAGAVETVLERIGDSFDRAVLDPPRRGCDPAALAQLARIRPQRIVYVACHPGTLARDCKILVNHGYAVERAEMIDLFPQTHHVESIVVLTTRG